LELLRYSNPELHHQKEHDSAVGSMAILAEGDAESEETLELRKKRRDAQEMLEKFV
jgi:hypothetical protein